MDFLVDDDPMVAVVQLADAVSEVGGVPCEVNPDRWTDEADYDRPAGHPSSVGGAKQICLVACPLLMHCRTYALKHREMDGIWGGLSSRERKVMWRSLGVQPPGSRKGIPNRRRG